MFTSLLKKVYHRLVPAKPYEYPSDISPEVVAVWRKVKEQGLTYLNNNKLASLLHLIADIEENGVEGDILEAGCALGGSAILMATAKNTERAMHIYDVFGMIPPPGEKDGQDVHERYAKIARGDSKGINGNKYYGYEDDLYNKVLRSFEEHGVPAEANNVVLHKGLVQDTLTGEGPVALAHVDVDWYDPVMTCLERVMPRLSPGGAMVLDDYFDWSGCRKAVDEFFDSCRNPAYKYTKSASHLVITKA